MYRVLGVVVATVIAAPAMAADLGPAPYIPTKAPVYAPAFSWTGMYVGGNVGGAWGTFDLNPATTNNLAGGVTAPGSLSINNNSVIGGFQTGYNWQVGMWVLGFEQDIQFTGLKQSFAYAGATGTFLAGNSMSVKTDYLSASRAKVGIAIDRFMVYAAGGLETGKLDTSATYVARAGGSPTVGFTDANKFHIGYTVGGGLEYAFTNNFSFGVEYRYFDLGQQTYNLGAFTSAGAAQTVSSTVDLKASEVTARLNLKLNGLGLFGM